MDGEEEDETPSVKADPIDFLIIFIATLQAMVETLGLALDKVVYVLVAHANHQYDRQKSINDFRLELENLPSTDQE